MPTSGRRPVGDDQEQVGLGPTGPEVVGEAEVVTDEGGDPKTLHLEGDEVVSGYELEVLARIGEGMPLVVGHELSVGTGSREPIAGLTGSSIDDGDRTGDPHTVRRRSLPNELGRRAVLGLGDVGGDRREPGREHLREDDQRCPGPGCQFDERIDVIVGRSCVLPHDVVLDGRDLHGAPPPLDNNNNITMRLAGRRRETRPDDVASEILRRVGAASCCRLRRRSRG